MPFNKQFFIKPPPIMLQQLAQERVISRYESLLETWSKVLLLVWDFPAGVLRRQ